MKTNSLNAVTFVENHDTQAGQALQTVIMDWFKPMGYAVILLRHEGYPCVFYGDYYGVEKYHTTAFKDIIDQMIKIRQTQMAGIRHDYFDHADIVGWTYEGDEPLNASGFAVLINNGAGGQKDMYIGKQHANEVYYDVMNHVNEEIRIREDGMATFKVQGGSYSIYLKKD